MASQQEIYNVLLGVGASPAEARELSAIAMAESGGIMQPSRVDPNSHGWFQINMNVHSGVDPYDPVSASQWALRKYREQGGQPWSVTHAAYGAPYRQYLNTPLEGGGSVPESGAFGNVLQDSGAVGGPRKQPSNTKPIYAEDGKTIIGYEVTYSDGSFDVLSPTEYDNLQKYGDPSGPPKPQIGGADNPSVSFSNSVSQYIPNAVDRLNAFINALQVAVEMGQIPAEDAFRQFQAAAAEIENELTVLTTNATNAQNAAVSQAQLQQQADQQAQDAAKARMEDERIRQSTQVTRDLGVAQERGAAAQSFVSDFLPYALPGGIKSLNLPLVGQVFPQGFPTIQANPDQVYNIAGMNAVSNMPGQSSVNIPAPSAVPTIPTGQIPTVDPNRYPEIPNSTIPQLNLDWNALLNALAGQL